MNMKLDQPMPPFFPVFRQRPSVPQAQGTIDLCTEIISSSNSDSSSSGGSCMNSFSIKNKKKEKQRGLGSVNFNSFLVIIKYSTLVIERLNLLVNNLALYVCCCINNTMAFMLCPPHVVIWYLTSKVF